MLAAVAIACAAVPLARAAAPTTAEYGASADAICASVNKRNIAMLNRARALQNHGKVRAGARMLIKNEHFEQSYYRRIAALPRPADPAINEQIDVFLENQFGQARERIAVGKGILRHKPFRIIARHDSRAVRMLRGAGIASQKIGFTQC